MRTHGAPEIGTAKERALSFEVERVGDIPAPDLVATDDDEI